MRYYSGTLYYGDLARPPALGQRASPPRNNVHIRWQVELVLSDQA